MTQAPPAPVSNQATSKPAAKAATIRSLTLTALAAIAVYLPFVLFASPDFGEIGYLIAVLLLSVPLLIITIIHSLPWLPLFAVFWGLPALFLMNHWEIRDHARWLAWGGKYKAIVLAQPVSAAGDFQHANWDGWGWAGSYTDAYVVFDPDDRLADTSGRSTPGKLNGLPCAVPGLRRLEKHWYAVTFYTDMSWEHCRAMEAHLSSAP